MKRLTGLLAGFFLLTVSTTLHAQTITACRDSVKGGYDFWLYTPEG